MKGDLHPRACEAAYAAEALGSRENSGPCDKLFAASLKEDKSIIDTLAQASGVDIERFRTESLESLPRQKCKRISSLPLALMFTAPRLFFLNGRPVADRRPQAVRVLIDHLRREQP